MQIRFDLILNKILEKPEKIFFILAFIFGSIFLFKTPPFEVPDEPHHLLRACEIADFIFYSKKPVKTTKYDNYFQNIDKSNYIKKHPEEKSDILKRDNNNFHFASRNSAIMYIASSLGIKIGSFFTQDGNILFYLGRFCNLLLYILLSAFAIKFTPVFKYPFMYIALLPMALYEGMSYSADSFNNGFAFLFFALIFKLIFSKSEITKRDFSILSVFSIIGAFCKGLVYPLALLPFLPKFSREFKLKKGLCIGILIFITLIICQIWVAINPKNLHPDYFVINDSFFLLKEPFETFNKVCITTIINLQSYFFQTIGVFGWVHIYLRPEVYVLAFMSFSSMFIFLKEKISYGLKITALIVFLFAYFIAQYNLLIYWSNPDAKIISGFQGRYLISMLPLLFIVFANNKFNFSDKIIKIYKILLLISIIYMLITSCLALNNFYNVLGLDRYLMDNYIKYGTFLINK